MKKLTLLVLTLLLLLVASVACAQTFTFQSIHARADISDEYILLTPDNLSSHTQWVAAQQSTPDELAAKWREEGVLLVAVTPEGDVRIELTAVADGDAQQYFDLDQQSAKSRSSYRTQHLDGAYYKSLGYKFSSAEWKKLPQHGRFLHLKYKRTLGDESYVGYARRTIRNGYTITLDYQVHGRSIKTSDSKAIKAILEEFSFVQVLEKPAEATAKVVLTSPPPLETNTGEFTLAGTCDAGLRLVAVAMRMSSPEPMVLETVATEKGNFSLDVVLPEEGVWLITMTVESGTVVTEELVFEPTTYQKTLLPVNLTEDISATLEDDELVISGTTLRNVTVQCMSDSGYDKLVKTNATGAFKFKLKTDEERTYNITLTFQKKNFDTRRFTYSCTRVMTEEDRRAAIKEDAVKPAYSTLTQKLTGYTGRIMGYNLHVVDIQQAGDQWILTMAMNKTKAGYKNQVIVIAEEEPPFAVDTYQRMYGTCTGSYVITDDEGNTRSYPSFELLFWEDAPAK